MKTIVLVSFALCLFDITKAVDNGKYRPEFYSKDGLYQPTYDSRYYDHLGRYQNNYYPGKNNYYNNYATYQPFQYNNLRQWFPYDTYNSFGKDNSVPKVAVASPVTTPTTVTKTTAAAPVAIQPKEYIKYHKGNEALARIVDQDSDVQANGYHFKYHTENGISAAETGVVGSSARAGTSVSGFYEYVGDDGILYRVDYTADENGFHPTGAHLP